MFQLDSEVCATLSCSASRLRWDDSTPGSPEPERGRQKRIWGSVRGVLFDFDGTLTATPGERADRRRKVTELCERSTMLRPWLSVLRDAGITIGIISKSGKDTIVTALEAAGLREFFDGPIQGNAIGFEGKAGFIKDMCEQRDLAHIGPLGHSGVLLVDDDIRELARAGEQGIQTYPAPANGGLLDQNFHEIVMGLGLQATEAPPLAPENISCLWTLGLSGRTMGLQPLALDKDASRHILTQFNFRDDAAPPFQDFYEVDWHSCRLGQGTFGMVKSAVHRQTGTRCALKFISKKVAGERYIEHFVTNDYYNFHLKMSLELPHRNVVQQLDYMMGSEYLYNAQELLVGPDLFSYLQKNAPVSESFCCRVFENIFSALKHIHGAFGLGVIHRDVKLENFRFRTEDRYSDLVLLDFGLACEAHSAEKRQVVGTLLYMAPEVFSRHYGFAVDLWSAGVVLYIMLTGVPPWTSDPSKGFVINPQIQDGQAVEAALKAEKVNNAPAESADLLRKLLVVDPKSRLTAAVALEHPWLLRSQCDGSDIHDCDMLINTGEDAYGLARLSSMTSPKAHRDPHFDGLLASEASGNLCVISEAQTGSSTVSPTSDRTFELRTPTSPKAPKRLVSYDSGLSADSLQCQGGVGPEGCEGGSAV